MTTYKKPLFLLRNGDKFIHEQETYTVFTHEQNMSEVFKKGKFYAWPNWNGKSAVIVDFIKPQQ